MPTIRDYALSALLSSSLLLTAACGSSSPTGNAPAATSASEPTTASVATSAPEPTAAPAADVPDTLADANISEGLDALDSYRYRLKVSFDGTDEAGKATKGSVEFTQQMISETKDQSMQMTATGDAAGEMEGGSFQFFKVGETTYIFGAQGQEAPQCMSFSGEQMNMDQAMEQFDPSDIVGGVKEAKLTATGETVNGILADRYSFDQSGLGFGSFSQASGDLWVAREGGYLVKYNGQATGKGGFTGDSKDEGTLIWEYNLEDVNKIAEIALPEECAGQAGATSDIPVPASATDKASMGKVTTFTSQEAVADLTTYYQNELAAQGWTPGTANTMGDLSMLEFTKESRKLSVMITKDPSKGVSSVMITEE